MAYQDLKQNQDLSKRRYSCTLAERKRFGDRFRRVTLGQNLNILGLFFSELIVVYYQIVFFEPFDQGKRRIEKNQTSEISPQ